MKDERVTQACCLVLTARARPPVRSEPGHRGSHTSQKARCMPARGWFWLRERPTVRERSRNVAWNQWFHKLRSHRGLVGPRERDAPPELGAGRRSRVRHGNENSQNEPGMSARINDIENRCGETADFAGQPQRRTQRTSNLVAAQGPR